MRQVENSSRVNISGIAATTGIPRGEVSRILNSSGSLSNSAIRGRQNISSKILSAWHCDPEYLTTARRPRDLKIFGGGRLTFESLVKKHGQGIPVRAVLDELRRVGAIRLLSSSRKIRPKMSLAIDPRITYRKIGDLDAVADDVSLVLLNVSDPIFVEKVSSTKSWSGRSSLVRKKIAPNAIAVLRELQTKLESKKENNCPAQKMARISVKLVYSEARAQLPKHSPRNRRNLDRKGKTKVK
jgi:hypothetical protein